MVNYSTEMDDFLAAGGLSFQMHAQHCDVQCVPQQFFDAFAADVQLARELQVISI